MVDPVAKSVEVLSLVSGRFASLGVFRAGEVATSQQLSGLTLDVSVLFAAAS